jgi:hypothetical protein
MSTLDKIRRAMTFYPLATPRQRTIQASRWADSVKYIEQRNLARPKTTQSESHHIAKGAIQ